jgi:hypothetical protein
MVTFLWQKNLVTSSRTKHNDIHTHYVHDLINAEIIKTLFTKNVTGYPFQKNASSYMDPLAEGT